jgi:hypothetical protein
MKGVANNVKSIDKYWPVDSLTEYIYLYVKAMGRCAVDFDITNATGERATLVAVIKRRDGVVVGRVLVGGKLAIEEDSILFKPVKTNVVEKGGEK